MREIKMKNEKGGRREEEVMVASQSDNRGR